MKINTNISNEFKELSVIINAPEMTEEIQNIIKYIFSINTNINQIFANKNNNIYIIDLDDVICFFSNNNNNYLRTKDDIYIIKNTLYQLDEELSNNNFIRISNSCIINIKQVEFFDTSVIGNIFVKLKDGTKESVSKRNLSKINKLIKQRRINDEKIYKKFF